MNKYLTIFVILILASFVNSCATQTNMIKSLQDAKKSILKIETWARFGGCDKETSICPEYELMSMGTGAVVLYDNKKAVLTAAHVCEQQSFEAFILSNNGDFFLKAIDRDDKEYMIYILKHDRDADICLLMSSSGELPSYLKISSKKPEYGEIVYNLAGPLGIIEKNMVPVYSGQFFGNLKGRAFYGIPVIGGSSGSPVINAKGELIGMIHSVHYKFHHISLSATYEQLWNFLKIAQSRTLESPN